MPLTDKEKQASRRAKMRDVGFKEILVIVHKDDVEKVRKYAENLRSKQNQKRDDS